MPDEEVPASDERALLRPTSVGADTARYTRGCAPHWRGQTPTLKPVGVGIPSLRGCRSTFLVGFVLTTQAQLVPSENNVADLFAHDWPHSNPVQRMLWEGSLLGVK